MPGLVLQAAGRLDTAATTRVGFTASRRVGGAVARNRARRRLKAAAAAVLRQSAAGAVDLVLIARPETVTRPFPALLADLETALRRTGVVRQDASRRRPT